MVASGAASGWLVAVAVAIAAGQLAGTAGAGCGQLAHPMCEVATSARAKLRRRRLRTPRRYQRWVTHAIRFPFGRALTSLIVAC